MSIQPQQVLQEAQSAGSTAASMKTLIIVVKFIGSVLIFAIICYALYWVYNKFKDAGGLLGSILNFPKKLIGGGLSGVKNILSGDITGGAKDLVGASGAGQVADTVTDFFSTNPLYEKQRKEKEEEEKRKQREMFYHYF